MTTGNMGFAGQTPKATIKPIDPTQKKKKKVLSEKEKYEKMWTVDDYRKVSPGELAANTFRTVVKPSPGDEIIDFGCGTGRGGFMLCFMGGMNVTMTDFASNCLDADVKLACKNFPEKIRFIEQDLNDNPTLHCRYGYCTDVMEHIPPDEVDNVLDNILESAQHVFFRISTVPDLLGPRYLKQQLHLSVHPYSWWLKKFAAKECIILYSEDMKGACDFYVTGWSNDLPKNPKINTGTEQILKNIRANTKQDVQTIRPHAKNDSEIMLLCGGPSLNDFEDEIIENHKNGMKVVTLNGTYNWAQERGITNVNQCIIDARPFNRRFVEPIRDDCNYFIASQCDPSIFEGLPKDKTYMWHVTCSPEAIEIIDECYPEYALCGGGSTVTLRAIVLMRILGFCKQHIYGFDSCLTNGVHHAYKQDENNYKVKNVPVAVAGRTFECQPWMCYQAFEFIDMAKVLKDEIEFHIPGDGLISHIIKTGAKLPEQEVI